MKVPIIKNTVAKAAKKAAGTGVTKPGAKFSKHLTPTTETIAESPAATENSAISGIGSIIAVQEVSHSGRGIAQKHMENWGKDVLDKLDEIRHGLLTGAISKKQLDNLARTLNERRTEITDPKLLEIVDDITLRAEVELAKLTRAG